MYSDCDDDLVLLTSHVELMKNPRKFKKYDYQSRKGYFQREGEKHNMNVLRNSHSTGISKRARKTYRDLSKEAVNPSLYYPATSTLSSSKSRAHHSEDSV